MRPSPEILDQALTSCRAILYVLTIHDDRETPTPTWVSPSVEPILGYTPEEALAPGWWFDGLHPEDHRDTLEAVSRVMEIGQVQHRYRFRTRSGEWMWIRDELTLQRDDDGRPSDIVGVWVDISAEVERQRELERHRRRLRDLVTSARDGIVLLDEAGRIEMVNPIAETMSGFDAEEMVGQSFLEFVAGHEREEHEENFRTIATSDDVSEDRLLRSVELRRRDGRPLLTEISLARHSAERGVRVVAIIRDVTERHRAERERDRLIADLQAAVERVRALQGLLPICSYCRRIRRDSGDWQQLEAFLSDQADVLFSHGVCPACLERAERDMLE